MNIHANIIHYEYQNIKTANIENITSSIFLHLSCSECLFVYKIEKKDKGNTWVVCGHRLSRTVKIQWEK